MPLLRPRACLLLISICGLLLTVSRLGSKPLPKQELYDDALKISDDALKLSDDALKLSDGALKLESISREGRGKYYITKTTPISKPAKLAEPAKPAELNTKKVLLPTFKFRYICQYACANDADIDLVIIVISDISNFNSRRTIRNTWGTVVTRLHAKVLFLVADSPIDSLQSELYKESALYDDIIQVIQIGPDDNPSLKSIAMLQWLKTYCTNSQFYMKVVDDTFVNVDNAISIASAWKSTNGRFFVCYVTETKPINNKVLRYCFGTAYIFSADILPDLYESSLRTELEWDESLFITGLAAGLVFASHVHEKGLSDMPRVPTGCAYKEVITGHDVTVKDMYMIFAEMYMKNIEC